MNINNFKYSIVVPVYETKDNFEKFVKLSESLITDQTEMEIIFVDDGNDYDLKNIINTDLPNFKLIRNKKNLSSI
jgi:glycosyltransferase involved in cell wall biosynthesis